ncbi:MAG: YceI family protein [Armatimonadetes bacterium]|nr:YceI family protein [Armatimonadota bacterium]
MKTFAMLVLASSAASLLASPTNFHIVGDKLAYRNLASAESVAEFETFTAKTNEVSGAIVFDPVAKTGHGQITVQVKGLDTGIPLRNQHLASPMWLDAEKYPTITFSTTSVSHLSGNNYRVKGNFTLHGVTKSITTTATVLYRAESDQTRKVMYQGDVIKLSTKFNINLATYGIKLPDMVKGKVAEDVTISVNAYASSK